MGLKYLKRVYRASKALLRRAVTGRGCRSSSSVGGIDLSGSSRRRNDTGITVSAPSHESDVTRMKY
jgi:hypothetical protein